MRPVLRGAVLLAALTVLAGCGGGGEAAAPGEPGEPTGLSRGPQGRVAQFVVECGYSHSATHDPIVHPGSLDRSHRHDFFGNVTTDATSTYESLLDQGTTCDHQFDTAAYWAPSLLDGGVPVTPTGSVAYYRAAPGVDPEAVVPYPDGLMVIAGDAAAEGPQPTNVVGWTCGSSTDLHPDAPVCPASAPLEVKIVFPDCWNGRDVDVPGHKAHMAYSSQGRCPASHPVPVPQLTFAVAYPITGPGHDLSLASGPMYTAHADFVNAWDPEVLREEIGYCINRGLVCGVV